MAPACHTFRAADELDAATAQHWCGSATRRAALCASALRASALRAVQSHPEQGQRLQQRAAMRAGAPPARQRWREHTLRAAAVAAAAAAVAAARGGGAARRGAGLRRMVRRAQGSAHRLTVRRRHWSLPLRHAALAVAADEW